MDKLYKLTDFIINKILIIITFIVVLSISIYNLSPSIFKFALDYYGFSDSDGLSNLESMRLTITEQEETINKINKDLLNLEENRKKLEFELGKALGERDGLIEGVKKMENKNYTGYYIIGSIIIITGASIYFIFFDNTGAIFKFLTVYINKLLSENGNNTANLINILGARIGELNLNIQDVTEKLIDVNNSIDLIKKLLNKKDE
jgi:hypothetical protein